MKCSNCGGDLEGDVCPVCGAGLKPPILLHGPPRHQPLKSEYLMIGMLGIPSLVVGSCCIISVVNQEITTAQPGWFMNAIIMGVGGIGLFCFVMVWALRSLKRP